MLIYPYPDPIVSNVQRNEASLQNFTNFQTWIFPSNCSYCIITIFPFQLWPLRLIWIYRSWFSPCSSNKILGQLVIQSIQISIQISLVKLIQITSIYCTLICQNCCIKRTINFKSRGGITWGFRTIIIWWTILVWVRVRLILSASLKEYKTKQQQKFHQSFIYYSLKTLNINNGTEY